MITLLANSRLKKAARIERAKDDELRLYERMTRAIERERTSNPPESLGVDTRRAERLVPHQREVRVNLANGKSFLARIMNLSADAVALDADFSAIKDADVLSVGGKHVEIGRRMRTGAVFLFKVPLKAPVTKNVVL